MPARTRSRSSASAARTCLPHSKLFDRCGVANALHVARQNHLQRIFRQAAFERDGLAEKFLVACVVCGAGWIIGGNDFENYLVFARPVEHDAAAVAPWLGDFKNARGRFAWQRVT